MTGTTNIRLALGGAAAPPPAVGRLRDFSGSVLNQPPSLVTPMLTVPFTADAGIKRFIAGIGLVVFATTTTNYNSFGVDLDGTPVTVNPLAPDTPSVFQTTGFKAHGFAFGLALGDAGAPSAANLNVTIGRFGGSGNFDLLLLGRLYKNGNQVDAQNLNNQYATVLSLNSIPGAPEMDSTLAVGDLLFSCGATAAGTARNPFQILLPAGPFNYGVTAVDGQASANIGDSVAASGSPLGILWDWGNTSGLGSYGNQWVVRYAA